MELSLIRTLMDKEFYDNNRGARCPDRLFSKDARKIKQTIDSAMTMYNRSITPSEVEALFMSNNPSMTTAQNSLLIICLSWFIKKSLWVMTLHRKSCQSYFNRS